MESEQLPTDAYTRVIEDRIGRGKKARKIRRPFFFERHTDRILELQTAYIDLEFGLASLNAQLAVLADLKFLHAWCNLKKIQNARWSAPEYRAAADQMPMTRTEIKDFSRWCQRRAGSLAEDIRLGSSHVHRLPGTDVVGTMFRNRRIRNASRYVQWLVTSLSGQDENDEREVSLTEVRRRLVERWFDKHVLSDAKAIPPGSLDADEAQALNQALLDEAAFPPTDIGTRDRLIFELLYQGLRAGELLKLEVTDVNDAYRVNLGRTIGIVSIERRPNDIDDDRIYEPAVKTRPGILPIPKRLAKALIDYVIDMRRPAVDARRNGGETPYLLVNHTGKHVGHPLSQRNLNRVVAKLKGRLGLPDSLAPHALRHTHFTELYDDQRQKGRSDADIRTSLIQRGRWSPNSTMPARYIVRSLVRESADYVEERDERLRNGKVSRV